MKPMRALLPAIVVILTGSFCLWALISSPRKASSETESFRVPEKSAAHQTKSQTGNSTALVVLKSSRVASFENSPPEFSMGSEADFTRLKKGEQRRLAFGAERFLDVQITASREDTEVSTLWIVAATVGADAGHVLLTQDSTRGLCYGQFIEWGNPEMVELGPDEDGDGMLDTRGTRVASNFCLPPGQDSLFKPASDNTSGAGPAPDVPVCSSNPSSVPVLFIDFRGSANGGTLVPCYTDPASPTSPLSWDPCQFSREMFLQVWQQVSEKYSIFDVNVTTDPAKYAAAPVGRKARMCITPYQNGKPVNGGIGGIMETGAFRKTGCILPSETVGWGFCAPGSGTPDFVVKTLANTLAHEFGHSLGLHHWGTTSMDKPGAPQAERDYYPVNGRQCHGILLDSSNPASCQNGSAWAPLMGRYHDGNVVQWCRGGFQGAAKFYGLTIVPDQDELDLISKNLSASGSGSSFLPDDKGDDRSTAATLQMAGNAPGDQGRISSEGDKDFFRFTTVASGNVSIIITPRQQTYEGALDVYAELQNTSGGAVAPGLNDPGRTSVALEAFNLPAGTYYVMVRGGEFRGPNYATEGFSKAGWPTYGSVGTYYITGMISGAPNAPQMNASETAPAGAAGIPYSFDLQTQHAPTSAVTSNGILPPGTTLDIGTGIISGIPTVAGTYQPTITVSNAFGSASKTFTFIIYGDAPLTDAVDALNLTWRTGGSGGTTGQWVGQRGWVSDPGELDAARSGSIGANSESWIETTVSGPGKIKFYWNCDCEPNEDTLGVRIGLGPDLYSITGSPGWQPQSVDVPNGERVIRWTYRTDSGGTSGTDAGYLDRVQFIPAPQFSSYRYLSAPAGFVSGFLLASDPIETTFTIDSGTLPHGLRLDAASGAITGTPAVPGTSVVGFRATNPGGANTTTTTFVITPNLTIPEGLDAPNATGWNGGGNNPWAGVLAPNHDGVDAIQSGPVDHNGVSWLEVTATGPGMLGFWVKSSSDPGDALTVALNGAPQFSISGEIDWHQRTLPLPTGTHTVRWTFARDGTGSAGQNTVWLDQLILTPPGGTLPLITSSNTATPTAGMNFSYFVTATNNPVAYGATGLPAGLSVNGTTGEISGVPLVTGTFTVNITAVNSSGGGQQTLTLNISAQTFAAGPDAPLDWTTSGTGGVIWFNQSAVTHDGIDALQSGPITHSQHTRVQATVYGPGIINYWWKVDSQLDADFLRFSIDGVEQRVISGSQNWSQRSQSISGAGPHYLEWKYTKDASVSSGSDAGWIDEVVWTPTPQIPVITSPTAITGGVGNLLYHQITATNSPTSFAVVSGSLPPGVIFLPNGTFISSPTRPGVYSLHITASNAAGASAAAPLTITIRSSAELWAGSFGLTGTNQLPGADPDRDGRINLLEMALGLSPVLAETAPAWVTQNPSTKRLQATFTRYNAYPDIRYEVQVSDNPGAWSTIARSEDGAVMQSLGAFSVSDPGGANPRVTVTDNAAPPANTKRYMRIKVTQL